MPERYRDDAEQLVGLLSEFEDRPGSYMLSAHADLHKKSRQLFQRLLRTEHP
jgi:hypothetical protein